jgi:SAP domain
LNSRRKVAPCCGRECSPIRDKYYISPHKQNPTLAALFWKRTSRLQLRVLDPISLFRLLQPSHSNFIKMPDYQKKTVAELTEILKGRSLPHSGKKADLIARLNEADKAAEASEGMRDSNDFSITECHVKITRLFYPNMIANTTLLQLLRRHRHRHRPNRNLSWRRLQLLLKPKLRKGVARLLPKLKFQVSHELFDCFHMSN